MFGNPLRDASVQAFKSRRCWAVCVKFNMDLSGNGFTQYHARYLAHELTKRCPSDSLQKLAATLADAQVDLNPHQIDAAFSPSGLRSRRGPFWRMRLGLGKTIEAGILLSQKWAEQKRKLLIIVPAALRKQWNQELADKFFLPSVIFENPNIQRVHQAGKSQSVRSERNHHLLVSFRPRSRCLHQAGELGFRHRG